MSRPVNIPEQRKRESNNAPKSLSVSQRRESSLVNERFWTTGFVDEAGQAGMARFVAIGLSRGRRETVLEAGASSSLRCSQTRRDDDEAHRKSRAGRGEQEDGLHGSCA